MRLFILLTFLFFHCCLHAQNTPITLKIAASATDSAIVMVNTQTDEGCSFMNAKEKEVIQWINIARMYPRWFIYFNQLTPSADTFQNGLYKTLKTMRPIKEKLEPDSMLWLGAYCHAKQSGITAYVGHDRRGAGCKKNFWAECISYGRGDAKSHVVRLLIDKGIKSLGHRKNCLNPSLKLVGVSEQDHKSRYKKIIVIDFK